MLKADDYRLQSNRKTKEGKQHPDRNEQCEYINRQSLKFMGKGEPVVSVVDTKKKELVGNFGNKGREWRAKGKMQEVLVHDFRDKELGKAIPYGVYDVKENEGWVSVGIDHDTAEFAAVVAEDGKGTVRESEKHTYHGRRRGEQREPEPFMENGASGPGR
jgi:hypothetical protein